MGFLYRRGWALAGAAAVVLASVAAVLGPRWLGQGEHRAQERPTIPPPIEQVQAAPAFALPAAAPASPAPAGGLNAARVLEVAAAEVPRPVAESFAREFMREPALRGEWDRYAGSGAGKPSRLKAVRAEEFIAALRAHPEFGSLVGRFAGQPEARAAIQRLVRHPEIEALMREYPTSSTRRVAMPSVVRPVLAARSAGPAGRLSKGGGMIPAGAVSAPGSSTGFDWQTHNRRRHDLLSRGDEQGAMEETNLILANSVMDGYMLNILTDWQLERDPEAAIGRLSAIANKYRSLLSLWAAAHLAMAQLYAKTGREKEADRESNVVAASCGSKLLPPPAAYCDKVRDRLPPPPAAPPLAGPIPGAHTAIAIQPEGSIENLLANGGFEQEGAGWNFGNNNRAVYSGGAAEGSRWLDTTDCQSCESGFGDAKTVAYDVAGTYEAGQQYAASMYFRSPQGGRIEFVVWEISAQGELLGSTGEVRGSGAWQRLQLTSLRIKRDGYQTLRVQVYYKDSGNGGMKEGTQYQFDGFVLRPAGECRTSYYTYDQPLNPGALTLNDLFTGRARVQTYAESQPVTIRWRTGNPNIDTSYANAQPSKLQIFFNKDDRKYYTFSRGCCHPGGRFNTYLLVSDDGVHFTDVAPLFDASLIQEMGPMYDAHVSVDYSVCPARWAMALECSGSMCASYTNTPFDPGSWSRPKLIVKAQGGKSASTGVFLIDGREKYAAWTVVDDDGAGGRDTQSEYSRGMALPNLWSFVRATDGSLLESAPVFGDSGMGGVLLSSHRNTRCRDSWDCNGKDKTDWKKEGDYYYLIYAGSNYYRCERAVEDGGSVWGVGIARSREPLRGYQTDGLVNGVGELLESPLRNTCGLGYPVVNNIGGELYLYVAYNTTAEDAKRGRTDERRFRLVPAAVPMRRVIQ